jgi:outer membrane protein assembly factor BamB
VPDGGLSTPVVAQEYDGDFLVNMSGSRRSGLSAYRLTGDGPQRLWNIEAFDRAASPVVYDGHVYAIAGGSNGHNARIVCVHVDTGIVAWEEIVDFAEVSSPVVVDGKVAAVCGTFLWRLQATPERYTVLSQADCQITLCTSPAVFEGRLFLRQANAIVCYNLRSAP